VILKHVAEGVKMETYRCWLGPKTVFSKKLIPIIRKLESKNMYFPPRKRGAVLAQIWGDGRTSLCVLSPKETEQTIALFKTFKKRKAVEL